VQATFRPYTTWPHGDTKGRRSRYSFKASWSSTMDLLERELRLLGARDLVIGAALREEDIRIDGLPRANARVPWHPGVEISFDVPAFHGPGWQRLVYATDAYESWEHNVRAIALGLEALRAVDRYGITRRGEQYAGFRQIEAASAVLEPSRERGRALIDEYGDVRKALIATHPDNGGDPVDFQSVTMAR